MAYMLMLMSMILMQGHSGLADEKNHINVYIFKCASMVRHDKFYFRLKSSVPVVLNYGHTSISYKTCLRSLRSVSVRSWRPDEGCNFTITLARQLNMTSNQTKIPFHW